MEKVKLLTFPDVITFFFLIVSWGSEYHHLGLIHLHFQCKAYEEIRYEVHLLTSLPPHTFQTVISIIVLSIQIMQNINFPSSNAPLMMRERSENKMTSFEELTHSPSVKRKNSLPGDDIFE